MTVASLSSDDAEREVLEELTATGVADAVVSEPLGRSRVLRNCAYAAFRGEPLQARYSWSPGLLARLSRWLATNECDIVHVEHLRGAAYGLALRRWLGRDGRRGVVVWDAVDCISSLCRNAAALGPDARVRLVARAELSRTERFERHAVRQFDRIVVTAETDRRDLLALGPAREEPALGQRLQVVSNGVDLKYFEPRQGPRLSRTLVMTAKMSYHANVAAAIWLVRDVMPLVWARYPDARLWIVGQHPPPAITRLGHVVHCTSPSAATVPPEARVLITGRVDDLRPFLAECTAAIAPLRYCVGVQNKVLEAMASGTPVIVSREAAAGLRARAGADLLVAADTEDLNAAISRLFEADGSWRARLGASGRTYVERHHDWSQVTTQLLQLYADALADGRIGVAST